jgi:hypothetical protein
MHGGIVGVAPGFSTAKAFDADLADRQSGFTRIKHKRNSGSERMKT